MKIAVFTVISSNAECVWGGFAITQWIARFFTTHIYFYFTRALVINLNLCKFKK